MRETAEERARRLMIYGDVMSYSAAEWHTVVLKADYFVPQGWENQIDSSYTKDLIKFKKFNFNFKFM